MQILSNTYNLVQLIVLLIYFTPLDIAVRDVASLIFIVIFTTYYIITKPRKKHENIRYRNILGSWIESKNVGFFVFSMNT